MQWVRLDARQAVAKRRVPALLQAASLRGRQVGRAVPPAVARAASKQSVHRAAA
jgi:hypothetical protein